MKTVKIGLLGKGHLFGKAFLDMYIECGLIAKALEVLYKILDQEEVISWNVLISGHDKLKYREEALK